MLKIFALVAKFGGLGVYDRQTDRQISQKAFSLVSFRGDSIEIFLTALSWLKKAKKFHDIFCRFTTMLDGDEQTDGRTGGYARKRLNTLANCEFFCIAVT